MSTGRFVTLLVSITLAAASGCGDNLSGSAGDCGNSVVDQGEECDDGNNASGDGCSAGCVFESVCGDNIVAGAEECDDGNTASGDGCSASCQNEIESAVCGNAVKESGEACDDGNEVAYDGCEDDCTASPAEVACFDLPPATTGVCDVTSGGATTLFRGDILTPSTVLRGGQVSVNAAGMITCVACDCSAEVPGATTITCPDAAVSPGLINPHDHITFVNNVPYTDSGERYEHRHDWRRGRNNHTQINVNSNASGNAIRYGELRFLMGGATSTIAAGSATGFLRNLDRDDQEGLGQPPVDLDVFPLGDGTGTQLAEGCGYPNITGEADIAGLEAYSPHVSEGIDSFARNEFVCLSRDDNGGQDLLEAQSAFIHGAGLTPIDYTRMNDQGTMLIWSPRSNVTLYGDTAQVTTADRLGVPIALGTDWLPTGSMNLLRELRCADELNQTYYDGHFSDAALWRMVTQRPAEAAAMDDVIGVLLPGRVADIAIFAEGASSDYRAVIDAEPADVTLVMRGGTPIYGDDGLVAALGGSSCDVIDVCTVSKRVCVSDEIGMTFAELETAVGAAYPLFFCGADPANEPSCVPTRPVSVNGSTVYDGVGSVDDTDGDGIINATDNCPRVFNPIRPVDRGAQADFDGDGEGDACDECPMDASVTDCLPFDDADPDADGVLSVVDNCPELANPGQADSDGDGRGNVCDACPASSNPAPIACPATIYEVKAGTSASRVSMINVLVTACVETRGFFMQVHEGEAIYDGPENSGVFVFDPDTDCDVTVSVGDRITISPSAQVGDFFGQTQLSFADFTVLSSGNPLPAVTDLAVGDAGGTIANAYEGILARVSDGVVTAINPPAGGGDTNPTNEFVLDGVLRVDDLIHATANFPSVGSVYESVTGVLAFRNDSQKMLPRAEADLVPGPPVLIAFAPASAFVREGALAAPTIPTPLTVTLSSPPVLDTFVAIASSDEGVLLVVGGGVTVLAGQTSAVVLVDALAQTSSVTLTASLAAATFQSDLRVIGAAEVPVPIDLQPNGQSVAPDGTLMMTVTIDFPAPAGGQLVDLSVAPGTTGSSVPAQVMVATDALSATFAFTAGPTEGDEVVTAQIAAAFVTADVSVAISFGGFVINEIDYDQVGADNDEFIELFNGTSAAIDLSDFAVILLNGSNDTQYARIDLGGLTLAAGQYAVLASPTVVVDPGALNILLGTAIQNGAPDGVALVRISNGEVIDAIAYENGGATMTAVASDFGTINLVEGTATAVADAGVDGSIGRSPTGTDTDDSNADWAFNATSTPGSANL